jgi:nucleotide-binding universal stress UspA family protein
VHPTRTEREPVELAVMLSCLTEAPLEVVGTYWFDSTPARSAPRDFEAKCLQEIQSALEEGIDTSRACSDVHVTAKSGSAAHVIHETARQVGAGLIVVGSTHRGPVGRATLGSTTGRVLDGAPCPVAVAPRGYRDPRRGPERVGVAFVDTPEGRAALRAAAQFAQQAGADLIAYTAVASDADESVARAEAALDRALSGYAGDLETEARVLTGGGPASLVGASQDLDVLVTGSRGHGPLRATMLGGVSHKLARDARCPLIVVPRTLSEPMSALFDQSVASVA